MKKKSFIVIVILLIAIILGLCVFIAYDKNLFGIKGEKKESNNIVEKKEDTNTTKEVDINSELVKSLVYPNSNPKLRNYIQGFILNDVNVSDYTRDDKMLMAQFYDKSLNYNNSYNYNDDSYICKTDGSGNAVITSVVRKSEGQNANYSSDEINCYRVSADVIKSNYDKLFGIDSDYKNGDVSVTGCGFINHYNSVDNSYYMITNCGGAYDHVDSIRKTYKAELKGDFLYIYDYAVIYHNIPAINTLAVFASYEDFNANRSSDSDNLSRYVVKDEKEAQSKLEELINSGKANTYIWTFKKQSDGKYYYYSSKWQ